MSTIVHTVRTARRRAFAGRNASLSPNQTSTGSRLLDASDRRWRRRRTFPLTPVRKAWTAESLSMRLSRIQQKPTIEAASATAAAMEHRIGHAPALDLPR
jgi:hypothetical protein